MRGRYPFESAWAFKRQKFGCPFGMLRTEIMSPPNNPEMWQDWFLGSDGIGFGILYRWTGTSWVENPDLRVNAF